MKYSEEFIKNEMFSHNWKKLKEYIKTETDSGKKLFLEAFERKLHTIDCWDSAKIYEHFQAKKLISDFELYVQDRIFKDMEQDNGNNT